MDFITTATSTDEKRRKASVAALPVGSFEQHGDHLPLTTDTLVASVIAQGIASEYGLFLLPPVTLSCSHEHEGFAGTVSISARTLMSIIDDVRSSLSRSDIQYLVLVNGHGGNYVLSNIAQEANIGERRLCLFPGSGDMDAARARAGMETGSHEDMHGGEWETSILLHAFPDLVRPSYSGSDHEAPNRPHLPMVGMRGYTDSGIIGYPSMATSAKGKSALDSLVESFAGHLKVLTG